ncbi:hypothetical protein BD310DRAFT_823230 [Dichomitus squalens]|uniref:Succinate dehydrogenase cytochrome b560 subunit n=1 Tax=Dichomitus squalens TaxID=114155 RepID=A0A4Q9PQL2_9APHY|nr:hypothetical protein BD310DRAFT_823230 [Dichomitus squalens]
MSNPSLDKYHTTFSESGLIQAVVMARPRRHLILCALVPIKAEGYTAWHPGLTTKPLPRQYTSLASQPHPHPHVTSSHRRFQNPPSTERACAPEWSYALLSVVRRRRIQTDSLPPSAHQEILNGQRLRRPKSPVLTIYQPQLTWVGSVLSRFTGTGLAVLLYGSALVYLVAPDTFSSAQVIDFISTLPDAVKYAGKVVLATPFAYHSLCGVRHIAWDVGKFLSLRGAYGTGYVVIAGTVIGTVVMVLR